MDIQTWISAFLSQIIGTLHIGYAFGAGMVSAVNPCGFAMLPAYLSLYLGAGEETFAQQSWCRRLAKAVGIALVVTAGFGILFAFIGAIVSAGGAMLFSIMPWLSVIVGVTLVLIGVWMLLGKHFSFAFFTRFGSRIGDPRNMSIRGFFLFGLAYGATSLGCTLPIFLVVVGGSLTSGNFTSGWLQFIYYTLGTGTIIMILTVGMAFIKGGVVVTVLRRFVPYVNVISGIVLILAGVYITYYWLSSGLLIQ
jgi:cytochrome c biogenesis protein CcdA